MKKRTRHSISWALVLSLVFSSVGYTAVSFACPKMKSMSASSCPKCEGMNSKLPKSCCLPKFEHKAVKSEFQKPQEFKVEFSKIGLTPIFVLAPAYLHAAPIVKVHNPVIPLADLQPVEKCALLSVFLI